MTKLNDFNSIDSLMIKQASLNYPTPFYLYDQQLIIDNCQKLLAMPQAFGLKVRYAMKANSNKSLLKLIHAQGLHIDASSLNEVRRAINAGIPYKNILLTTQEVPKNQELLALQEMMKQGLKYNVCSLQQLYNIADFVAENKIKLALRFHPGKGSGESASRNTADQYCCFGIQHQDIRQVLAFSKERNIVFDCLHSHIGSGADAATWKNNITLQLAIVAASFPDVTTVNFGGGFKVARMPREETADITDLGNYAKVALSAFYQESGRKLSLEIEPGNFVIANAGFVVATIIDKKQSQTTKGRINFLILDGGMELNTRPLLYGCHHPFYIIDKYDCLKYSQFDENPNPTLPTVVVGSCCESGDSQCLSASGRNTPRQLAAAAIGDLVIIGGCGAYCSSMAPFNYNSRLQVAELLCDKNGRIKVIRQPQSLQQLLANEI